MKQIIITIGIALVSILASSAYAQENMDAKKIQAKSLEATRVAGTESLSTMTIINQKGKQRVRKMAIATKLYDEGQTEKKLIRFLSPSDVKDVGFLTFDYNKKDDDKWIYMPALRKTRRIISSENAKSFMGSEFSYADMTLPNLEEYTYKYLGEKVINDVPCYKIEIIPINDEVIDKNGFTKKISFIGKADFVLRKAIYYDLFEEVEKIMIVSSVIEVDKKNHKFRFGRIEIENVKNGRKSISETEQIVFNPNIPDEYFTSRYLEK
jgi:outer membrane lipoprotein-sorting protein